MEELSVGAVVRKAQEGGARLRLASAMAEKLKSKAKREYDKLLTKLQ